MYPGRPASGPHATGAGWIIGSGDDDRAGDHVIIGEGFGWSHLPKTGGTATLHMFREVPEAGEHQGRKHDTFADHEDELAGKVLASNFRRLPTWVLSWAQHRTRHVVLPDGTRPPLNTPEQMATATRADRQLNHFLSNGRFTVDRWLRTEQLAEDFIAFASEFYELNDEQRRRITEIGLVGAHEYDHELESWFTPDMIRQMYRANPLWASIERKVYGDLAIPD
jgi:hypothetical protein